ncbi:hypothetical protein BGX24_008847, partial [Mortierella sp. AD032]
PKAGSSAVTKAAAPADPEVQAAATAPEPILNGRLSEAEKPKIILSNMRTTTFRDALHPDAESATAIGSIANPTITLGLNDVNTPIPESELSTLLQSNNNKINNKGEVLKDVTAAPVLSVNSTNTGSVSWKSASTPPMSPVPSIPESMSAAAQAAAEADDAALSDNQDLDQCCSSPIPGSGKSSVSVSASSSVEQIATVTAIAPVAVVVEKKANKAPLQKIQQQPQQLQAAHVATAALV